MSSLFKAVRDACRFRGLPDEGRRIVFYSEGRSYTKYLLPVARCLVERHGATLAYLTSDPGDPVLQEKTFSSFYVGAGAVLVFVFQTLRARVLVTTTPDLQTFHLKRSAVYPVHYTYVQHSMVSTHMVYRPNAFDSFDSVLCAGPYQIDEMRAWEKLNKLPEKKLFAHGYAPLDALMSQARGTHRAVDPASSGLNVLVAPSWGRSTILEAGAEGLIDALLTDGHHVTVRPHPRTLQTRRETVCRLRKRFTGHPRLLFDLEAASMESLLQAQVMISDWSGVAMEFALGLERPVLFIDCPCKINNPRWEDVGIVPVEVFYRSEVGAVLDRGRFADAPATVRRLHADGDSFAARARALRQRLVFKSGNSDERGAAIIAQLAGAQDAV